MGRLSYNQSIKGRLSRFFLFIMILFQMQLQNDMLPSLSNIYFEYDGWYGVK